MNGFMNTKAIVVLVVGLVAGFVGFGMLAGESEGPGDEARTVAARGPVAPQGVPAHGVHPAPRPAAEREAVVPAGRYAKYPRIANVYRAAAEIPGVLDGIHCYCDCDQHAGHYSLLTCFADDHGAMCDICLNEAETAFKLTRDGVDLEVIRDVIDRTYGG